MIFLTADNHGMFDMDKITNYFKDPNVSNKCTKDDYLIILGDAGIMFYGDSRDRKVITTLQALPVTVLFIDGNHENFELLEDYPVDEWHGGRVHEIEEDILHLMRGEIFEIDHKNIFTFGGAFSIDRASRRLNETYWKEEIPSIEEMKNGIKNLNAHKCKVDLILTHSAPYEIVDYLGYDIHDEEYEFLSSLDNISQQVKFSGWYYGHYHQDDDYGKFHCIMNRIIEL